MVAIRKYREQLGISQEALAGMCGVVKSAVSMWETGDRKPDIIMLKKLSGILGCTTDELLEPISTEEPATETEKEG